MDWFCRRIGLEKDLVNLVSIGTSFFDAANWLSWSVQKVAVTLRHLVLWSHITRLRLYIYISKNGKHPEVIYLHGNSSCRLEAIPLLPLHGFFSNQAMWRAIGIAIVFSSWPVTHWLTKASTPSQNLTLLLRLCWLWNFRRRIHLLGLVFLLTFSSMFHLIFMFASDVEFKILVMRFCGLKS